MNYGFVLGRLGLLLLVLSGCTGLVSLYEWAVFLNGHREELLAAEAMASTAVVGAIAGGLLWWFTRQSPQGLHRKEAMLLTALSWLVGGLLAALPFYIWAQAGGYKATSPLGHEFTSFISCYFEAVSGLTTTGATVLGERGLIEDLPGGLLLWRSLTHWLGGLGIVVLFVAVLPNLGVGAKRLFQTESSAQESGVRPRIGETARILWLIYLGLTAAAATTFYLGGMSVFDAINHAFSVMSTGGYSTKNASIGHYDSFLIDWASVFYMILAGVNFVLFYRIVRGRWKQAFSDVELRWYLSMKVIVSLIITFNIWGDWIITSVPGKYVFGDLWQSARFAWFHTAALHTGTGFGTADYGPWPRLSLGLLFGLMLIGGCAGSTAGGIKVVRFVICVKVMWASIERAFRPNVVRSIKLGQNTIDDELKLGAMIYAMIMILLVALGTFALMLLEPAPENGGRGDILTCTTASLATIANVGPGMGYVNAVGHYGWFSGPSKLLLSLWMVLGRLEMYAVFVLFSWRFWRSD